MGRKKTMSNVPTTSTAPPAANTLTTTSQMSSSAYIALLVLRMRHAHLITTGRTPAAEEMLEIDAMKEREIAYINSISNVKKAEDRLAALEYFVNALSSEDVEAISSVFAFQGFNARACRQFILMNHVPHNVYLALIIYLERGTKLTKMRSSMSEDAKTRVATLVSDMSLKESAAKTDYRTLTLGRIAACFPDYIAKLLKKRPTMAKAYGHTGGLPVYLMFPQAASIIPTDNNAMFQQWSDWSNRFTHVVNGQPLSTFGDVVVGSPRDFKSLIWKSDLFTNDERKNLITELSH